MTKLSVQQILLLILIVLGVHAWLGRLWYGQALLLSVLLRELLRVVDTCFIVGCGEDMPGLKVLRVYLRSLLTMVNDLLDVTIL